MVRTYPVVAEVGAAGRDRAADLEASPSIPDRSGRAPDRENYEKRRLTWS